MTDNPPPIPYGRQSVDEADIEAVVRVLRSAWLTQGPMAVAFEEALARYCGGRYAVVFSSGTSALHAAYFTAGLRAGDEFVTSPITFAATANAGLFLGARPVFAEVEPDTGNIDPDCLERAITGKTRLIVPVHYAGHPAAMKEIRSLSIRHGIRVVEDACHALGAAYRGGRIGNCAFSDMAVFSFHPVKPITAGEGGAVLTNDESDYRTLRMFREHGISKYRFLREPDGDWYYEMQFLGHNYRMTDIQAALGLSQLRRLDPFIARRREIAEHYNRAFAGNAYFDIPPERDYARSGCHLYPIRLKRPYEDRKNFCFTRLRQQGLAVQVHYIPVYRHPYYLDLGYREGICPAAERFYRQEISLPIFPSLTDEELDYVVKTVVMVGEEL